MAKKASLVQIAPSQLNLKLSANEIVFIVLIVKSKSDSAPSIKLE